MSSYSHFAIIGPKDNPLYELEIGIAPEMSVASIAGDIPPNTNQTIASTTGSQANFENLSQFAINASLDMIQEISWGTRDLYLKIVDRFASCYISAYLLPTGPKFVIFHSALNSDGIKHFFGEVHELWLKMAVNPFFDTVHLQNGAFDQRVKVIGRKWLVV